MSQTALVIGVPEASGLLADIRMRLDPSAAAGMPEHITLMFPFLDSDQVDPAVLFELGQLFAMVEPFSFRLAATGRFDEGVLYLLPEPERPFVDMTMAIMAAFGTKPYGGAFETVVPHLTAAQSGGDAGVEAAIAAGLPIVARAAEAWLMVLDPGGRWRRGHAFSLGS